MTHKTIGIDFDNTIVSYDSLTIKLFKELYPEVTAELHGKAQVRDYLRSIKREDVWTEMQGTLYGVRISEAESFEGFMDFIREQSGAGSRLCIVSHKTRFPFKGPQYDLHQSAWNWLDSNGILEFIRREDVFFEETKTAKLARIGTLSCSSFIDDLVEILTDPNFPPGVAPILFNPGHEVGSPSSSAAAFRTLSHWSEAKRLFT
ncbi:MAG: haloacid dehalogenase-like hydrolase [Proteobacteria bacterium]|nr:haloacid dehalogenase-like hydrolase [Pseudomonadota bacterium]